jgi:hypothetical protein
MTGISFEPKLGAAPASANGPEAPASAAADQPGFAPMLAAMSRPDSNGTNPSAELSEALALLRSIAAEPAAAGIGQDVFTDRGFLGGSNAAHAGASDVAREMAAIFNEFGLFGEPVARLAAPDRIAGTSTTQPPAAPPMIGDKPFVRANSGAEPEFNEAPRLRIADTTFWSGPEYAFVTQFASTAGDSAEHGPAAGAVAAPSTASAAQTPQSTAVLSAGDQAADEMPAAEQGMRASRRPDRPSGADPAPRMILSISEQVASLVARLERLSRDERIRLYQEAGRLLAAHGLVPNEIRINGSVDGRRNT